MTRRTRLELSPCVMVGGLVAALGAMGAPALGQQVGACCLPDGSCQAVSRLDICENLEGQYLGDGTNCEADRCPDCDCDGESDVMEISECVDTCNNACDGGCVCEIACDVNGDGVPNNCSDGASNCDDEDWCTLDTCDPTLGCVYEPRDTDGDGDPDCVDTCPSDPVHGTEAEIEDCYTARVRAVVRAEPSGLDEVENEESLPSSAEAHLRDGCFVVEVWAQSTLAFECSLQYVFVELSWDTQCSIRATDFNYSETFSHFRHGDIDNDTGVISGLGAATTYQGVGVFPRWDRVVTVRFETGSRECTNSFMLEEDEDYGFAYTLCDPAWSNTQGDEKALAVECPGVIYDVASRGRGNLRQIDKNDLSRLRTCWMRTGDLGACAEVDWDCDGVVGPADVSLFATAWMKDVCDDGIVVPACQLHCDRGDPLPAWAEESTMRHFGLPIPPSDWLGWAPYVDRSNSELQKRSDRDSRFPRGR